LGWVELDLVLGERSRRKGARSVSVRRKLDILWMANHVVSRPLKVQSPTPCTRIQKYQNGTPLLSTIV
jgi:hypothetical protein